MFYIQSKVGRNIFSGYGSTIREEEKKRREEKRSGRRDSIQCTVSRPLTHQDGHTL